MDMRVGTDVIDVQKDTIPDLDAYETVVLLLSDLDPLKEKVLDICEWVEDGGSAMFALTLQKNTYVSLIANSGINPCGFRKLHFPCGVIWIHDRISLSATDQKLLIKVDAIHFCILIT